MSAPFVTKAEMRRYLEFQHRAFPDIPPKLWDEYSIYVSCVCFDEHPKSLKEWLCGFQ